MAKYRFIVDIEVNIEGCDANDVFPLDANTIRKEIISNLEWVWPDAAVTVKPLSSSTGSYLPSRHPQRKDKV